MKNVWCYDVPNITDILSRSSIEDIITEIVSNVLTSMVDSRSDINEVISMLFDSRLNHDILEMEKNIHLKLTNDSSSRNRINTEMHDRSRTIFTEIEQHLTGDSLADVGCGHGLVSWMAYQKFKEVMLFDVIDYRYPEVNLPIQVYEENQDASFDKKYDCTLLITVLHHSQDPLRLLKHVWKHTNKRLIIIESVFGVDPSSGGKESPLYKLNETDQQYYAVFCDWFYNRVLNQDVPVPYNFNTPQKWKTLFQEELSAIVSYEEDLAIDIPIVPEHHFLFVLDKK
jgi:hypothetical protein